MQIIKLDAIDSTNLYLKDLSRKQTLDDFTVVVAEEQHGGKGQMGADWLVEKGKNLTFSFLKQLGSLPLNNQFDISICASLAVYDSLRELKIPDVKVKWPNDIMSGASKICGILVENRVEGQFIKSSIIGIGLNVNQTNFEGLVKAGSLRSVTGRNFDLEELLELILERINGYFQVVEATDRAQLQRAYELVMFRKDAPSEFDIKGRERMNGFIRGISEEGKLLVEIKKGKLKEFGLKELTLLY